MHGFNRTSVSLLAPLGALALAAVALMGCGDKKTDPPPADPSPASQVPDGPVEPEEGVVWVRVLSHETLPSLHAAEPMAMTGDDRRAALEMGLLALGPATREGVTLVCKEQAGGDAVRFWVERNDTVDEDTAVALAEELAASFLESAEARFQDRVEVALLGLGKQLEAASNERTEVQTTLRDYLEINRGRSGTAETRREQAELERNLARVNERVGEMQDLVAELERMLPKGQPWYRRVD